ncbi:BTAD domain-containing putative transcriptional regulator [Kribbella sp. NPDC026596]|uniref:BTAD domain-containing putative transcriptional regulator n=1 Tax=Kribbella sp. NPDC026596 TaxID=3155122 RepID=UPI00340AB00B
MQVRILGPLEVVADGEVVLVRGARLRALMIRLALDAGRNVSVDSLLHALWPDGGPADQVHALQSLVSRLRRVLPGSPLLQGPGGYRLEVPPDAVDALQFERLVREGRRAIRDGNTRAGADQLRAALALWHGEALTGAASAPYSQAAAGRLEELRLSATEDRIAAELLTVAEAAPLVAELHELVAGHPLRERLRLLLVKALHADGRSAEALTAYDEFRRLLADELGADPGPELQNAHLAVLRGEAVARSRPASPRGNLPVPLTSFVGRDRDRTEIAGRLRDCRLVTLVGPGGAGKSRLATAVAAELADDFGGGVWLVELAPVVLRDDVALAVADALGLRDAGRPDATTAPDPARRLAGALPAAETVVVLDNCEHLIDPVAQLVEELLGRCPQLRILTTSREPLGILGETLVPVAPLELPEPGLSLAETLTCPAVRLFADRATAVRADFTVTDANADAVIEICCRLDGLPLAIELAAARLRFASVDQLAAGLGDRFHLLTGGSRTALPRHRTLRAVVAWSWDLLSGEERRTAERLAVFPATFAPQAAVGVGTSASALDTLVDRSLLQLVDGPEPRYRMLETIREYGVERLAASGEIDRVRAEHAAYFLELAEEAEPWLRGFGQLPWIGRLAADRDNLLAALRFACETDDADTAVRLGAALAFFWTIHGDHAEATERLRTVLDVPGHGPPDATATAAAGFLFNAVLSGDRAAAQKRVGQLRTFARACDHDQVSGALVEATIALISDDAATGLELIDNRAPDPDPWARGMLWLTRSFLDGSQGDMTAMRRDLVAAAAAFREAGERWGLATVLTYLAFAHATLADFEQAIAAAEESSGLVRELGLDVHLRVWLAMVRIHIGDLDSARAELLDVVAGAASAQQTALARLFLADVARCEGDFEEASRQLALAADCRGMLDDPSYQVLFHAGAGFLAVAIDDVETARTQLSQAFVLATQMLDMPMVAVVGVAAAQLQMRCGRPAAAAELLGAAHALRGSSDALNPDVADLTNELDRTLGPATFQTAYDRGRRLDRLGAIREIEAWLDVLDEQSP